MNMTMNKLSGAIKMLGLAALVTYGCGGKPVEDQTAEANEAENEIVSQETVKVILLS